MWLPVAVTDAELIDAVSDNDAARVAEGCTPGCSPTSVRLTIRTEAIGIEASATDSTLYWNSSRCTLRPDWPEHRKSLAGIELLWAVRVTSLRASGDRDRCENTYENIAGPAIELNFELNEWHESVFCGEVLVADNDITDCGVGGTKPQQAIYLKQKNDGNNDVDVLNNIQLTGNVYSER